MDGFTRSVVHLLQVYLGPSPTRRRANSLANQTKTKPMKLIRSTFLLMAIAIASFTTTYAQDPLPSWSDGAAKHAIVDFVKATTEIGGSNFFAPDERITTLDP